MVKKIIALLLVLCMTVSVSSCQFIEETLMPDWDDFVEELFISSMQSDTLSMHFFIENPEDFGIEDYEETLGSLVVDEDDTWASDSLKAIESFNYRQLSEKQQYEYDILHWYFETEVMGEDFDYYQELAAPTYGIQANYPMNMADYSLIDEEDVEHYFALLEDTPRYFDELLQYEQKRSEKGMFMTDVQLAQMLADCENFAGVELSDNVLVTSFEERVDQIDGLSASERDAYKEENREHVEELVLPAYRDFMDGMEALEGTGEGSGSIADYENGREYYEYLARGASSSDRSVEEMQELLEKYANQHIGDIYRVISENYALLDQMESPGYGATEPEDILKLIAGRMDALVPAIPDTTYTVRYVPESLQQSLPPAFCYVPQIDNIQSVIYINPNPEYDSMDFYTTVAHEGFPGHMYQNTYFYHTDPALFRYILSFTGYTEGWACYISYKALSLSDIEDPDLITLLIANEALGYEISALADIGVNYEGWTPEELGEFMAGYGYEVGEEELIENYNFFLNDPAGYLSYSVSCCEFWELEVDAKLRLKSRFDEVDFHRVLLEAGPSPFSILSERLDRYAAENGKRS